MKNIRRSDIDIMRGLCMSCVILGHSIINESNPVNIFVLSFHMLAFYFISGMCFHETSDNIKEIIIKKCKSIGYPLVMFSILAIVLSYPLYLLGANKTYNICQMFMGIFTGSVPAKGFWFVYDLFWISLLYPIIIILTRRRIAPLLITGVSLIIIEFISIENNFAHHIQRVLMGGEFYALGDMWTQNETKFNFSKKAIVSIFLLSFLSVSVLSQINTPVFLYKYEYGSIVYCISSSLLGSIMLWAASKLIIENKMIEYIGKNSLLFLFAQFYTLTIPMYMVMKNNWNTPNLEYPIIIIFFIFSMSLCFLFSYVVNKYTPWIYKMR